MLKRKSPAYPEAGIANDEIFHVNATPILPKSKSGVAVLVTLQHQARHHEVPSGQGFTPSEASKMRVLLSSQLYGLRAARSRATDCSNKLGTRRMSSSMIIRRCRASDDKYFKETRRNCTIFGIRQTSTTRPRKHDELVLPHGSRYLPEAACGCIPSTTPCRRYNLGVRNTCIRFYSAIGDLCSSHMRGIHRETPVGWQRTTPHEICQKPCKSTTLYQPSPTVAMTGPNNSSKPKLIRVKLAKCLTLGLSESVRGIKSAAVLQVLKWPLN